jgi:hypothetical protein
MISEKHAGVLTTLGFALSFVGCKSDIPQKDQVLKERETLAASLLRDNVISEDERKQLHLPLGNVFAALRSSGASLTVIEGVGILIFSREALESGVVDRIEHKQADSRDLTTFSLLTAEGRKNVVVAGNLKLHPGQTIEVKGLQQVMINRGVDFLSDGPTAQQLFTRYEAFVELLQGNTEIYAVSVLSNGKVLHQNIEPQLNHEKALRSPQSWGRLLAEFE